MRLLLAVIASIAAAVAHGQEIVTLQARAGVTQSYLLVGTPQQAQAVAVLFPGGAGNIRLRLESEQVRFSPGNFLVRSRTEFVSRGVAAAVVDTPSDQQPGMADEFRLGEQHYADILAVVQDLRKRFPGIPVFLAGTSRGTISAASIGKRMGKDVDGVVLTATLFLAGAGRRAQPGLSGFDFGTIPAPLLFVHHRDDACNVTPYQSARQLANRFPLVSVSGGLPPQSEPCEAMSNHGFLGKESETVAAIVNWMLKKPFPREIH